MKIFAVLLVGLLLSSGVAWGGNYTDNLNGTVTDNVSGLVWQRLDDQTTRNWEAALTYCENLTLASYTDWRLPNIKELEALTDKTKYGPCVDEMAFPISYSQKATLNYWTSTTSTYVYKTDSAWDVSFQSGRTYCETKTYKRYVLCVRGGQ